MLHVVDEVTNFQTVMRLANMTVEELWRVLKACWIKVYLGPPYITTHDAGTNFVTHYFQDNAQLLHITCMKVLLEAANRMSIVKRYHEQLRRTFRIIRAECTKMDFE